MSFEIADWMRSLSMIFLSLFVQGLPFLLLGAMLGAWMATRTTIQGLLSKVPRHPFASAVIGALTGFLLPSCECFAIPLVRRLKSQGLPTSAAIAYLLAAPTLNPLALMSTWSAFATTEYPYAVLLRVAGTLVLAIGTALVFSKIPDTKLWNSDLLRSISPRQNTTCYTWKEIFLTGLADFRSVCFYYIIGCFLAALLQNSSFLPLLTVNVPAADTAVMMIFAYVACVCSSADAFIASSLTSISLPAKMAFLWLGPVLDLKLTFTYPLLIKARPLILLSVLILGIVVVLSFILGKVLYSV